MKLHKIQIEGYRRHYDTEIMFSNASFLIGENNTGKSSILKSIELLLTDTKTLPDSFFFKFFQDEDISSCDKIILTAEFRGVPDAASEWVGFKGRIFPYTTTTPDGNEVTGNSIFYRKTFVSNSQRTIEMRARKKTIKAEFKNLKKISEFTKKGLKEELLIGSKFENENRESNLSKAKLEEFLDTFENKIDFFDYSNEEEWAQNPGGIAGNVLSKLPKVLYIPAHDGSENLGETKGTFQNILSELFTDVRKESDNYKKAQEYLDKLAAEMNPEDSTTEFGKMMEGLNGVLDGVFAGIGLNAQAELSNADDAIKPKFSVSMTSNIPTSVEMQGTGVIRSTVFALLRYKALRDMEKKSDDRSLIICFEEPELYLHPNAANQMRDTIYALAMTSNNQIVCSTHSPYMIDLSKQTGQVLNYLSASNSSVTTNSFSDIKCELVNNSPFNIQEAFTALQSNERDLVKLILKIDDYLARIFFAKNILIVEGDTEEIVLKETISLMPDEMKKNVLCNWQIVRARGKGTIISLVKYLKAMGITPYVMHDLDNNVAGAKIMNEPIREVLNDDSRLTVLENCIEDILGYEPPSNDKPYKAYQHTQANWQNDYNKINKEWRAVVESIFS
ncbi:ATP-dependent endonuclease [Vagococcus sp. DIV0080]|uniref:ATP-dependent endonuclease n=1 Tax=Candidatus Vagococcus giribetii TaxID=2230876 RepID=A0ABS3HUN8_9ENTE|nr:ATP-dependent endonuclease [Vagococcus sp. DIV0080]MBO0477424.1 ATP-dependent endonuclease [Vagococcus sp. DIV0080]